MNWIVIGSDGNEYGPADTVTLREWIVAGSVTEDTVLISEDRQREIKAKDLLELGFKKNTNEGSQPVVKLEMNKKETNFAPVAQKEKSKSPLLFGIIGGVVLLIVILVILYQIMPVKYLEGNYSNSLGNYTFTKEGQITVNLNVGASVSGTYKIEKGVLSFQMDPKTINADKSLIIKFITGDPSINALKEQFASSKPKEYRVKKRGKILEYVGENNTLNPDLNIIKQPQTNKGD